MKKLTTFYYNLEMYDDKDAYGARLKKLLKHKNVYQLYSTNDILKVNEFVTEFLYDRDGKFDARKAFIKHYLHYKYVIIWKKPIFF